MDTLSQLIDLYLNGHTPNQIQKKLKIPIEQVEKYIKELGLEGYATYKVSKPQELIYEVCCGLFGRDKVKQEESIGHGLRVDVAVPHYGLMIEYHGRQHFEFIEFFHSSEDNFEMCKVRDRKKKELCEDKGYKYILFTCKEKLTKELVHDRIMKEVLSYLDSGQSFFEIGKKAVDLKKEKQRQYRKERYRVFKERRKNVRV